jgi:ABC-type transport system involved in multi-copper enzyme maturation permease subunit
VLERWLARWDLANWHGLGVIFYCEWTRLARDWHALIWRVIIIVLVLLVGLNQFTDTFRVSAFGALRLGAVDASLGQLASFANRFVEGFFTSQAYFFVVVGPGLFASAIVSERERGRLEALLLTGIAPWAIVSGKLLAHWLHLAGLLLATVPLLALAQLWGGVDYRDLLAGYGVQLSGLLSLGAMCLAITAAAPTVPAAFVAAYAVCFFFWVLLSVASGGRLAYAANPALFWFDQSLRGGLLPLQPGHYLHTQALHFVLWQLPVTLVALMLAGYQLQPSGRPAATRPPPPTDSEPAHPDRPDPHAGTPPAAASATAPAHAIPLCYDMDPLHWKERIWLSRRVGWWLTVLAVIGSGVVAVGLKLTRPTFDPGRMADLAQWFMLTYPHWLALGVVWAMGREFQLRTLGVLLLLPIRPREILQGKVVALRRHLRWLLGLFGLLAVAALARTHLRDGQLVAANWLGHLLQLGFCAIYTDLATKVALWSVLTRRRIGWAMAEAGLMLVCCWWLPPLLATLLAPISYTLQDFCHFGLTPQGIVQSLQASDAWPPADLLAISGLGMAVYWLAGRVFWWECIWRLERLEPTDA